MPTCSVCGKGPQVGNRVSHAHNKTKRRWNPNLQKIRVMWEGRPQQKMVCSSCIRAGKVVKAPRGLNQQASVSETPAG